MWRIERAAPIPAKEKESPTVDPSRITPIRGTWYVSLGNAVIIIKCWDFSLEIDSSLGEKAQIIIL